MDDFLQCERCQELNAVENNFCWQCGIGLKKSVPAPSQTETRVAKNTVDAASSVVGILGAVLAGALGGIVVGAMIILAMVLSFINAIFEFLDNCSSVLVLLSVAFTTIIYSIAKLFF